MATFSERLRKCRERRELTQSELADKVGVHKQTISQYERGVRNPDYTILRKICSVFGVSTDYMLGREMQFYDDYGNLIDPDEKVSVPVYGQVAAGIPMEMIEDITDTEDIPKAMTRGGKQYFALKIHGNSMEPRMRDGDVIIVRKQPDAEDGEIVVAAVNGDDATCKRLKKYKDAIALLSTNPDYDPIYISKGEKPVTILGKVVELRAKFE